MAAAGCSQVTDRNNPAARSSAGDRYSAVRHVTVYGRPGRFCGWPANNGAWNWGDEILVCFDLLYFKEPDPAVDPTEHHVDWDKPGVIVMARSLDGGESWKLERPHAFRPSQLKKEPVACPNPINFTHPDFAMRLRNDRFHISYDRGRTWLGPYEFPDLGVKLGARTDYIVNGRHDCSFFLSTAGCAICVRTTDGGKTFDVLSEITGDSLVRAIMPSTVRTSQTRLLSAVRRIKGEPYVSWIDVYVSNDNGRTWNFLSKVANADNRYWNGNPPSMVRLPDGRICITYGYRAVPCGIRAKISTDFGKTWGPEIVLRRDGRNWDLGYSRTVQRSDGKLVTMYYYSTQENPHQRIIATIWDPDSVTTASVDERAIEETAEHIDAIEESMGRIGALSRGRVRSVNPIVRWTQIKERHCDKVRKIIAYDLMSQRLKPADKADRGAYKNYRNHVSLLQEMHYYNFQAKQTNDLSNVEKLRALLAQFRTAYLNAASGK
jgi:hypothetical protein